MTVTLITGPARSGKSEWAEQLAQKIADSKDQTVMYIATAQTNPEDTAWEARIEKHRQRRPKHWQCQEVPVELAEAIAQSTTNHANAPHCLLVDSLGTWLANLIEQDDAAWDADEQRLLEALQNTTTDVVLVAEETGWGVVPAYALGRRFRDRLGSLSRKVGAIATDVYLVTGGYALNISTLGQAISPTYPSISNP